MRTIKPFSLHRIKVVITKNPLSGDDPKYHTITGSQAEDRGVDRKKSAGLQPP